MNAAAFARRCCSPAVIPTRPITCGRTSLLRNTTFNNKHALARAPWATGRVAAATMATSSNNKNNGRSFQELKEAIARDVLALDKPSHLITTLTYGLALYSTVKVCAEAGIFQRLAASSTPLSAEQLVEQLPNNAAAAPDSADRAAQVEYITRQLQGVSGLKLVDEIEPAVYCANELTHTLAHPGFEAGVHYMYRNLIGPGSTLAHMAQWAVTNGYKAPEVATDGPYQRARNIVGTPSFTYWMQDEPESQSDLNIWMQRIQQDRLNWSAWFPAEALFQSSGKGEKDGVFMVDVGGGLGHDINAFAARYPDQQMRLVVQDMPDVIAEAKKQTLDSRIELIEHNFFKTQPVKGAKIYFMHKIIHDWPDEQCVEILTQLRDAMAPDSRLFLNDAIIPDKDSPVLLSAFDISMLALLSGKERSESMWTKLIRNVGGLEIKKFWQAPGLQGEGIVEVVKTA